MKGPTVCYYHRRTSATFLNHRPLMPNHCTSMLKTVGCIMSWYNVGSGSGSVSNMYLRIT
jgi:hypothetical protein